MAPHVRVPDLLEGDLGEGRLRLGRLHARGEFGGGRRRRRRLLHDCLDAGVARLHLPERLPGGHRDPAPPANVRERGHGRLRRGLGGRRNGL
eukprot:9477462-Alexandrium_andersonii.AAC.1